MKLKSGKESDSLAHIGKILAIGIIRMQQKERVPLIIGFHSEGRRFRDSGKALASAGIARSYVELSKRVRGVKERPIAEICNY